ncbi:zinc-binding alcohol dehydrogenase [Oceanobacillus longus]|uniref:Zinc-binding alcohol dehydrogenase n=1 Tax=Oceanobacillus longus TaxID=930120 RepID=A0ABV8H2L9_9BACI
MQKLIAYNKQVKIVEDEMPVVKPSYVLIKTMYSAISPGTELMAIEGSEGRETEFGYSAVGMVVDSGDDIQDVANGDLVACYGAPYVHHSEYLLVPKTLYSKIPTTMEPRQAALSGIGAIAIHALRVAKLQFGETVIVVGLGLLGQMIAKIANAAAYNVIAYDLHESRANMLLEDTGIKSFTSIDDMEVAIGKATKNNGVDAVLLCAGGKRSPLTNQSLNWIRNKGKVVIVGDVEPEFPREKMFAKEAEILISRAGGPGRYDKVYEAEAIDYPYGFVRWTEGRNIEEYIRLVNEGRIDVSPFLTEEISFTDAPGEFQALLNKKSSTLTKIIRY